MNNTGQIVRSRKTAKTRYTPINNDILQSWDLSSEEKAILIYLLSMPEDWVVIKGQLIEKSNMGRDRFNKAWKGLQEKGYVISIRVICNETKQLKGWNHIVYEEPVLSESRVTENPKVGNPESRESRKSEIQSVYKVINKQSNNNTKEEESTRTKSKIGFVVPTIEDVIQYMTEIGIPEKSDRFYNYYQSNGWKVGKNPMKDWKAAARNFKTDKKETTILPNNFKVF